MDYSPGRRPGSTDENARHMPTGLVVVVAVLILIPIVALMWVSSYARHGPELWGFPFFYWYQFCWVFVTAILTTIAYRIVRAYERRPAQPPSGASSGPDDADVPGDGGDR